MEREIRVREKAHCFDLNNDDDISGASFFVCVFIHLNTFVSSSATCFGFQERKKLKRKNSPLHLFCNFPFRKWHVYGSDAFLSWVPARVSCQIHFIIEFHTYLLNIYLQPSRVRTFSISLITFKILFFILLTKSLSRFSNLDKKKYYLINPYK